MNSGRHSLKAGPSASKISTAPKGILRTKRPREDDDEEGPKPKRQFTLCSRPKVQPNQAPNGKGVDESGKGLVGDADGQDRTNVEQITTTSTKPKDDLGGNKESMAQGEPPVESKTAPINDKHKRPTVESDLNDEWTDEEASNNYPVDLESQDDDGTGNKASLYIESLDNDSLDNDSLSDSSSDEDSLANSSEDNDNDSTDNSSTIAHHTSIPHRHPTTNRSNPIFSNQTLTSQNLPSGAHLSRCNIAKGNILDIEIDHKPSANNVLSRSLFKPGNLSYIFHEILFLGINNWALYFTTAYRSLKHGGIIEHQDLDWNFYRGGGGDSKSLSDEWGVASIRHPSRAAKRTIRKRRLSRSSDHEKTARFKIISVIT
ncbi:MAG: hypothetical protein L6R38_004757 [Xanthoria sp. 2 TBL-2021]|nr:MAG: hypothetical protein L6R38_004757 [Xanthoria sp. 2 TBL-2021]